MKLMHFLDRHPNLYDPITKYVDFEILVQPPNLKKMKLKIIVLSIIATFVFDMLTFCYKLSQSFISDGKTFLAVSMLILYFARSMLQTSFGTYETFQYDFFDQESLKIVSPIVMNLCSTVRNKVFKVDDDGKQTVIEHAELKNKTESYINSVWNFFWRLPKIIASSITLFVMITSSVILEIRENNSWQNWIIFFLLFISSFGYIIMTRKRVKIQKSFRKSIRDSNSEEKVMQSDINKCDFISTDDFEFHSTRYQKQLLKSSEFTKTQRLYINKAYIVRSTIFSSLMISIILIKALFTNSGAIDIVTISSAFASASIYSQILTRFGSIMENFETLADIVIEIKTLYPEFKNIYDVFEEENAKIFVGSRVDGVTVNSFTVSHDPKKTYKLHNDKSFVLHTGDFILIHGPTGCGKSTLLSLLTGKLRIKDNPISFSNGSSGYLKSINYQTDNAITNNYVLQEIALTEDIDSIDKLKLFEILHGLCLFEEFLTMANCDTDIQEIAHSDDDKVFELMNNRKFNQFSSGQKQRLALAKLLYTMTKEHQVIALDEAFNRLNDSIAQKCVDFVRDYICRDTKRIVLIATHQINIVKPVCNRDIAFSRKDDFTTLIVE